MLTTRPAHPGDDRQRAAGSLTHLRGRGRAPLAILVTLPLLVLAVWACGGDSAPAGSPSPPSTGSPAATPQASQPGGSPAPAERVIDVASDRPASVLWGADAVQPPQPSDFSNDLPALAAGDINGDSLDDLLVGVRFGDGPENARKDSGEAYLILGSDKLPAAIDLAAGQQSVTIYGAAPNDQIGFSGTLADVNDDGLDDIILGAPFAHRPGGGGVQTGAVYVIFGRKEIGAAIDLARASPNLTLLGPEGSSYFGDSLATTDANGDGTTDIVVGATFARHAVAGGGELQVGAVYVFFGADDLGGVRDVSRQDYDVAIYGSDQFDEVGDNVAGGDLNGDDIGDIIVTAEAADGPGAGNCDASGTGDRCVAAEVYVVYGSPDLGGVLEVARGDQDVTVYGAEQNDTLGFNIAAGDVSGDGVDDLLMTARGGDGPDNKLSEAGEVHIVLGGDLPETIDLAKGESDAYVYGSDAADFFGVALTTADLDGDGSQELLVGAPFGDGPGNARREAGEAYALDASGLQDAVNVQAAPLKLALYGSQTLDGFGAALAVGDLDGDGQPEIAVLAVWGDGPEDARTDAGELYILKP